MLYTYAKMGVKGQGHTKVKNVHNMLSQGDTPIGQNLVCLPQAKIWYASVKERRKNLARLKFMVKISF